MCSKNVKQSNNNGNQTLFLNNISGKRKPAVIKSLACFLALTTALLTLTACGGGGGDASADSGPADISAYDSSVITLKGIGEEDISISVGELREMESVTEKAEASRSNGEKVSVKATGPLLDTVLAKYGVDKSQFNTVRLNASDGYSIAMTSDILEKDDVILAYLDDGKLMSSENGPVRAIVPGERAMYWVRMLESIEFESDSGTAVADKVVFLDTALAGLENQKVEIAGSSVDCVSTDALISAYANIDDNTVRNVYMTAYDGLSKNETKENFLGRYLRVSGEHAPEFTGPDLQEGMTVNGLLTINYGDTAFMSVAEGLASMGVVSVDGTDGLPFSSVIKKIGSMSTDTYVFTDLEGNTDKFTADELSDAVIYIKDGRVMFSSDGSASASFGSAKGAVMTGLLSISAE